MERGSMARWGVGLAVMIPALAIGGTSPWVVPPFAMLVAGLVGIPAGRRAPGSVPSIAMLGAFAALVTMLQIVPIPGVRVELAPALDQWITLAEAGVEGSGPAGLSAAPADTALELLRLLALTGLTLVTAQRTWRTIAAAIVVTAALVATIGLVQYGLDIHWIYGLYDAKHAALEASPAMRSTFVSPNHQSALLLLGLTSTAALMVDVREGRPAGHALDRWLALAIALVVQLAALVLSLSRGALIVALVLSPVVLTFAWRPAVRRPDRPSNHALIYGAPRIASRMAGLALLVGIVVGLGTLGAWHELQTLRWAEGLDPSTAARVRVTGVAFELIELAPLTGIGRGVYGDLASAFDPAANHVWYSHVECAPVTLLLEWGVLAGGALLVLLPAWWLGAMRRAGEHEDARARRIALLGLLALALHGLTDFSLEFLGVGAPAAALAGSLSPRLGQRLIASRARVAAVGLAAASVAGVGLVPSTWAFRGEAPAASIAGRPLDASRHRHRARAAARAGRWDEAMTRARAAVRLQPGQIDSWLLLAAAGHARGERSTRHNATREALERVHEVPDDALLEYLVESFADPEVLARMTPDDPLAWDRVVRGLLTRSPAHADAMATVRRVRHPEDPAPLRVHVEANLRLERPALALHHARLWRRLEPRDAQAHLGVVRALQSAPSPRPGDVGRALERALREADISSPRRRGIIEEQLLLVLAKRPGPAARSRARTIARALRTRPAEARLRRRWRALAASVLEAR